MGRKGEGIRWMLEIGKRRKDKEEKKKWAEEKSGNQSEFRKHRRLKVYHARETETFSYLVFYVIYVIRSYGNVKKFSQPFFMLRQMNVSRK